MGLPNYRTRMNIGGLGRIKNQLQGCGVKMQASAAFGVYGGKPSCSGEKTGTCWEAMRTGGKRKNSGGRVGLLYPVEKGGNESKQGR